MTFKVVQANLVTQDHPHHCEFTQQSWSLRAESIGANKKSESRLTFALRMKRKIDSVLYDTPSLPIFSSHH